MLSRLAIRPDLRIPGLFGELIGESFRVFALLMNQRRRLTRKTLITDIDGLLFELSGDVSATREPDSDKDGSTAAPSRTKPAGYVVLAVVVVLVWAALVWGFLVS